MVEIMPRLQGQGRIQDFAIAINKRPGGAGSSQLFFV